MNFKIYMEDTVNAIIAYTKDDLEYIKSNMDSETLKKLEDTEKGLFDVPLQTIVNNEKKISKNKHLYESLSIYTWPNPDTEDGLPYITRDGYVNFDHVKNDKENLRLVSFVTYKLAILYFLTEDKKYYDILKKQLETFFINEDTRMIPDMRHGQAHLGLHDGCSGGIIDIAISFGYSLSAINALKEKGMLEDDLVNGLKEWTNGYIDWILEHPFGEDMRNKPNNHSMVYNYYVLMLSKFSDRKGDHIQEIIDRYSRSVINQIKDDGSMPLELKRKKARSYTMMNTKLILEVYKLLDGNVSDEVKEKIKLAIDFYVPYATGEKEWPYEQTQFYYHFYDIGFLFMIKKDFNKDHKIVIKKDIMDISDWTYLLYKNIIEIEEEV